MPTSMTKVLLIPGIVLAGILMQGCLGIQSAPPPAPVARIIEKERVINKPFEDVWQRMITLLAVYNMPIKNLDKSSGFMATEYKQITGDPAIYMDCVGASSTFQGKVELTNQGGNLNVLLQKISDDSTKVIVNVFYSYQANKYRYAGFFSTDYVFESSTKVDANSTGNLEKAIFEYLAADPAPTTP